MAFNAGDILAKLKLDGKQFKAGLTAAGSHVKGFKSQMLSMGNAIKGIWAAAIVTSVTMVTKRIYEMAKSGAALQDMEKAFDRMASRAGISRKALVYDVKQITNALTNKEIMQSANTLELLGVGMENLPKLTQIARAAAVAMGKDVGYMLESIATGTARQSRLWLDNLGIIISVEDANESYAKSLGKTAKELTDTEQRAAFLNAVLTKGDDIINAVGTDSANAADKVASLGVAFENLRDFINKAVASSKTFQWILKTLINDIHTFERQLMLKDLTSNFEALNDVAKLSGAQTGRLFAEAFGGELKGAQELSKIFGGKQAHAIMQEYIKANKSMTDEERGLFNKGFEGRVKYMLELLPAITGEMSMLPNIQALSLQAQEQLNEELKKTARLYSGLAGFSPKTKPLAGPLTGPQLPYAGRAMTAGESAGVGGAISGGVPIGDLAGPFEMAVPAIQQTTDAMQEMYSAGLQIGSLTEVLGDSFGALFEELTVGSDDAGRAFASSMLRGIAQVADQLGSMYIWAGLGMEALVKLKGAQAIVAGLALKAVAGIMRGAASKNAPIPYSPDRAVARQQETEHKGGATFIVEGDFMGEKYWIDVLAEKLYGAQRDRNVKLIYGGA